MYWLAKTFQAAGLAIMVLGFIKDFPHLMGHQFLLLAILFFAIGWIIQTYMTTT